VTRLRVTGNVLRRLHSFHPLVDIPQMVLSWMTFFRWGTYRFPASHVRMFPFATVSATAKRGCLYFSQKYSPGGATIGSPICTGTLHQCTFSSSAAVVSSRVMYMIVCFSQLFSRRLLNQDRSENTTRTTADCAIWLVEQWSLWLSTSSTQLNSSLIRTVAWKAKRDTAIKYIQAYNI